MVVTCFTSNENCFLETCYKFMFVLYILFLTVIESGNVGIVVLNEFGLNFHDNNNDSFFIYLSGTTLVNDFWYILRNLGIAISQGSIFNIDCATHISCFY
ncbi:hypothetical protein T552_04131 [Pneumocystis carinii B80]|uniref:Uncharacterized protein n=1 Tax=Pneumocystis carinii (strain B80) TaxID=1408658 RepID=A0A0W4ZI01_PNEC8|nr:hypothetical protein T552_04131 [Pneumocystis carinii B80]KTW27995.1 hypothetical protein T552_04131 [Pneumocystis carinii B80]